MQYIESFYKKTVLEHLMNRYGTGAEEVSEKLQITSRQLADWLEHRHAIPLEQLTELEKILEVPMDIIADENKYARRLTPLSMIDLDILDVKAQIKTSGSGNTEQLRERLEQLQAKREKHKLFVRIASVLENPDPFVMDKVNELISNLEK